MKSKYTKINYILKKKVIKDTAIKIEPLVQWVVRDQRNR